MHQTRQASMCAALRASLVCLAFATWLPAAAQDPWRKIASANFELYTTAGDRAGRDLLRHFELPCGPQQPPRALRIEYQALPAMAGVAGLVRTLEFR
jgi:hypothetical protein